jgi:hypothetical protein
VGRFGDIAGADNFKSKIVGDIAECKTLGKEYLPVIWPGFSWANMHHGTTPQNQIPRIGGALFWEQAYNCVSSGATMLYNAMFDEVDEGTAILKACPKKSLAPADGYWLTLDADGYDLPSDWYLRLAGYAKKMLAGKIPVSKTMPLNPNKPDSGWVKNRVEVPQYFIKDKIYIHDNSVRISLGTAVPIEITVMKINGEIVKVIRSNMAGGSLMIPLSDCEKLSSGVYLLRIKTGNRDIAARTVVVNPRY